MSEIEIIPGVRLDFTETGIASDVLNAWMPNSLCAAMGKFDELKPVQYYGEYFLDKDRRYEEAGKLGLFKAIMRRSNPAKVIAIDRLVDEFNTDLPRIVEGRDNETVQRFLRRVGDLNHEVSGDQTLK